MNNKKKQRICLIMFFMIVMQIIAINLTASIYSKFKYNQELRHETLVEYTESLISETIRGQQRYMLSSIKQSWIKYIETNPNNNLIVQDEQGNPLYSNEEDVISFDKNTMFKIQMENLKTYNIYCRESGEVIIDNAKPNWDSEKLEDILNILVAPNKLFGNNGGLIVYDSNSGKIFLDTTPGKRLENGENVSIFNDHENKNNKNKEDSYLTINEFFKAKRDSHYSSNIVYMFNESFDMNNDFSNFHKYPLGQYNRQFVEMSVMPYETIGFNGQPMQLTILSIVDEQDVYSVFKSHVEKSERIDTFNQSLYNLISLILLLSLVATMIIMTICLYILKYKFHDEK